jgi:hypothetical protein
LISERLLVARPLTRAQAIQNRAFLKALRRTGNVRLSCRELGLNYATMQRRRAKHPHFAHAWDAALVAAQARLAALVRQPRPQARPRRARTESPFRTQGGEPVVVRRRDGRLQLRRAPPGRLTREAEQAFLAALSATCNVRLAAAAVGAAHSSFYWRRRRDPAFAREERMALERGYLALELALLESGLPGSHEHDDWRSNDPLAIPPMTAAQALQLMYLHQKEARLTAEPAHIKRRRGESQEAHSVRLTAMYEARLQRAREAFDVAEAERRERGEPSPFGPEVLPSLPDLAQVPPASWSKADPDKPPHDPKRALFGGWRIEDMEEKLGT